MNVLPLALAITIVSAYLIVFWKIGRDKYHFNDDGLSKKYRLEGSLGSGEKLVTRCRIGKTLQKFMLDTGFQGSAIYNRWYVERHDLSSIESRQQTLKIEVQSVFDCRELTITQHNLMSDQVDAAFLQTMWEMHIPDAPHILTMDCILQMQPLQIALYPQYGVLKEAVPSNDMVTPIQRWKNGLLEIQIQIADRDVWAVVDTGYNGSLLLRDADQLHTSVILRDVHGQAHRRAERQATVVIAGVELRSNVTLLDAGPREAYVGLQLLHFFDLVFRASTLRLKRNHRIVLTE